MVWPRCAVPAARTRSWCSPKRPSNNQAQKRDRHSPVLFLDMPTGSSGGAVPPWALVTYSDSSLFLERHVMPCHSESASAARYLKWWFWLTVLLEHEFRFLASLGMTPEWIRAAEPIPLSFRVSLSGEVSRWWARSGAVLQNEFRFLAAFGMTGRWPGPPSTNRE